MKKYLYKNVNVLNIVLFLICKYFTLSDGFDKDVPLGFFTTSGFFYVQSWLALRNMQKLVKCQLVIIQIISFQERGHFLQIFPSGLWFVFVFAFVCLIGLFFFSFSGIYLYSKVKLLLYLVNYFSQCNAQRCYI